LDLHVKDPRPAGDLGEGLDPVESAPETSRELGERLELRGGVAEVVAVRVDDRRDGRAADLVEEDKIGCLERQFPAGSRYAISSKSNAAREGFRYKPRESRRLTSARTTLRSHSFSPQSGNCPCSSNMRWSGARRSATGKGLHEAPSEIHKRALEGDILTKDVAGSLIDRYLHTPFAYPTLREQLRNAGVKAIERYFDTHGKEIAGLVTRKDSSQLGWGRQVARLAR
jgi:hypothetical protein